MRAPVERFTTYSEPHWARIKGTVLHCDADTIMMSGLPTDGDIIPRVTLRTKLEWFGQLTPMLDNVLGALPTPKVQADFLTEKLDQIEEFRRSFEGVLLDYGSADDDRRALDTRLQSVLSDVSNHLRPIRDDFAAIGGRSKTNAANYAQNAHLEVLHNIWREIGGAQAPRKALEQFIVACASPVFPDMAHSAVRYWLDNHCPGRKSHQKRH